MNIKQKDVYDIGDKVRILIKHKKSNASSGIVKSVRLIHGFRNYELYRFAIDTDDGTFDYYTWQLCLDN